MLIITFFMFSSVFSMIVSFNSPCTCLVTGATFSGKTTLISQIIKFKKFMFKETPRKIIYFYGEWNKNFDSLKKYGVTFVHGLPDNYDKYASDSNQHHLFILDDLIRDIMKHKETEVLFTRKAHHKNISCFVLRYGMKISCKPFCIFSENIPAIYHNYFISLYHFLTSGSFFVF